MEGAADSEGEAWQMFFELLEVHFDTGAARTSESHNRASEDPSELAKSTKSRTSSSNRTKTQTKKAADESQKV